MHVEKPSNQWLLASHMHGCHGFDMPRPAVADVMVHYQNVENASFVVGNFYYLLGFSWFWPTDLIV